MEYGSGIWQWNMAVEYGGSGIWQWNMEAVEYGSGIWQWNMAVEYGSLHGLYHLIWHSKKGQ